MEQNVTLSPEFSRKLEAMPRHLGSISYIYIYIYIYRKWYIDEFQLCFLTHEHCNQFVQTMQRHKSYVKMVTFFSRLDVNWKKSGIING